MKRFLSFFIILAISILALLAATGHDYEWTTWFRHHRSDSYRHLIENTIFKGQLPGPRDLVYLILVLTGIMYVLPVIKSKFAKLFTCRHYYSFILISALACLLFTHVLKWGVGRPRPKLVYGESCEFVPWYECGPKIVPYGAHYRSMPSGHTTTMAVLISVSYVLFSLSKRILLKIGGVLMLLVTLAITVMMGISRAMSAHWVTDGMVGIFGCWLIIHLLFIKMIPTEKQAIKILPTVYLCQDLKLCQWLIVTFGGLLLLLCGVHSLLPPFAHNSILAVLIIPGLIGLFWGASKIAIWDRQNSSEDAFSQELNIGGK